MSFIYTEVRSPSFDISVALNAEFSVAFRESGAISPFLVSNILDRTFQDLRFVERNSSELELPGGSWLVTKELTAVNEELALTKLQNRLSTLRDWAASRSPSSAEFLLEQALEDDKSFEDLLTILDSSASKKKTRKV